MLPPNDIQIPVRRMHSAFSRPTLLDACCTLPTNLRVSLLQEVDSDGNLDWVSFGDEASLDPSIALDNRDGTYRPAFIYSYEQESYEFSYSFELEDFDSYSFEFIDSMSEEGESSSHTFSYSFSHQFGEELEGRTPQPGAVQSVTSIDVSVCPWFGILRQKTTRGELNASRP